MKWDLRKKNDGKWLERLLAVTHRAYADTGIAKIEKVEPPTCTVRSKTIQRGVKVVQLRNPFVDFIGTAKGRAVCMEAKSTKEPKLHLLHDGGITKRQWDALVEWENNGAMCGIVWGYNGDLRFLTMKMMKNNLADGTKTMHWEQAEPIAQGVGFVLNDWLLNMRSAYSYPVTLPL